MRVRLTLAFVAAAILPLLAAVALGLLQADLARVATLLVLTMLVVVVVAAWASQVMEQTRP